MKTQSIMDSRRAAPLALVVLACACADHPVATAPTPEPSHLTAEYTCTVEVRPGTVTCREVQAGGGAWANMILGSPFVAYVTTASSSRGNSADEDTTGYTVAIHNATPQPLGTTDGINLAPGGVRLLFTTGPVVYSVSSGTTASASIRLETPDGTATFTNQNGSATYTNRMYFQYNEVLAPGDTTAARSMKFIYSSNVSAFSYGYRVSAPSQYEHGWVAVSPGSVGVLSPGGTVTLTGTVYNQVGQVQADGITWSSSNPGVATVNASTGEVTAVAVETATITATSSVNGQRTGSRAVIVDAAPAVTGTTPADGATDATPGGAIVVQFSEAVSVSGGSFTLGCTSGSQPFTISGSGTGTVTLYPVSSLPTGDTCTVVALASYVSDLDANDGPDHLAENYSFWFVVEGFGGSM